MRFLPCRNAKCPGPQSVPQPKRRGLAALPGGIPYVMGRPPYETLRYVCAACKHSTTLTIHEYNALPVRKLRDLEDAKLGDLAYPELASIGVSREQALQLEAAGVSPLEVHAMPSRALADQ